MVLSADLERFVALFLKWNERINLSAARDRGDVTLQVVDCMALLPYVCGTRILDVGSGGGLPALVLAIAQPSWTIRSLEPVHKKAAFQSAAVRELGLKNIEVCARRLEPATDVGFDTAVSRATFDLLDWLPLGARAVRPGGVVLAMEGKDQRELPPGAVRHPYEHGDRTRAVIRYEPPAG